MSISRVSTISCDQCRRTAELMPTDNAGRSIKPVGWARLSISAKTAPDQPVEVVKTADLCPECVQRIIEVIDNKAEAP